MTVRTRSETVVFDKPFVLTGLDGLQPAGRYTVEIDEELLPTMSLTAYRRLATWFRLPALVSDAGHSSGRAQVAAVDPVELEAALARDASLGWGLAVAGRLEALLDDEVLRQVLRSAGLTPDQFKMQLRDLAHRVGRMRRLETV